MGSVINLENGHPSLDYTINPEVVLAMLTSASTFVSFGLLT